MVVGAVEKADHRFVPDVLARRLPVPVPHTTAISVVDKVVDKACMLPRAVSTSSLDQVRGLDSALHCWDMDGGRGGKRLVHHVVESRLSRVALWYRAPRVSSRNGGTK